MQVSVIVTVYNERDSIGRLLASLAEQTRLPDEVVICDGGSNDGTVDVIHDYCGRCSDRLSNVHVLVESPVQILAVGVTWLLTPQQAR